MTPVTQGGGEAPSQLRSIKVQLKTTFGRTHREKTGICIQESLEFTGECNSVFEKDTRNSSKTVLSKVENI